jgi:hypothetical protein
MAATDDQNHARTLHEAQMYQALGAFLLFFALVVLLSILFTGTGIGKLTNLGAAAVLGVIGGVMFLKGLRSGHAQQ